MSDPRERKRPGAPAEERQAGVQDAEPSGEGADRTGRVPPPSPEEAPELLGERSDYPVPFGEES
jgi:hypothetical protein